VKFSHADPILRAVCAAFFTAAAINPVSVRAQENAAAPAKAGDAGALAALILDESKPGAEREAGVARSAGIAGAVIAALVSDLKAGTPEEYKRIPWIWRVAVAAGKRNDAAELKALLEVSLPKPGAALLDWQAVVIGGGVINGLTLVNVWPGDRVEELLKDSAELKAAWQRSIDLAAAMADEEKVPNGTRYDALRMLGVDTWEKRGAQLTKYLAKGVNDELQQGAVSALADMKCAESGPALISGLSYFSEGNRNFALDGLLRNSVKTAALLDAIEQKKIDAALLGMERIKRLRALPDEKQRERARKLLPDAA
jgi:hypothetical protein